MRTDQVCTMAMYLNFSAHLRVFAIYLSTWSVNPLSRMIFLQIQNMKDCCHIRI